MDAIILGPTDVRVALRGFDASRDGLDKMVLAGGLRTGQIIEAGSVTLTRVSPTTTQYIGSVNFGAGDLGFVPEVMGGLVYTNGKRFFPPCGPGPGLAVPATAQQHYTGSLTVSRTGFSIDITNLTTQQTSGLTPGSWAYVVFRKPAAGGF